VTDYTNAMRPVEMLQVSQVEQRYQRIVLRLLGIDPRDPNAPEQLRLKLVELDLREE
jgi:hypothetical protein